MSENRSEFEISIKSTADMAGLRAANAALEGQREALKKMGQDYSDIDDKILKNQQSMVDLGAADMTAGKAGEEAGEKQAQGAHHAELSHRELRESVRAVTAQFGGLADVGLWLNPMTAGLAAVLALVEGLKKAFEDASAAVGALAAATAAIDDAKMKGLAQAIGEAATNLNQFAINQERLNTAYAASDAAMETRIKQYGAEVDAVLKVDQAKEEAWEAEIKRRVKMDLITKEHGEAMIEDSKLQLESERGALDQAKLKEEIDERKKKKDEAAHRLMTGSNSDAIAAAQAAEIPIAGRAAAADEAVKHGGEVPVTASFPGALGTTEKFSGTIEEAQKTAAEYHDLAQDLASTGHEEASKRREGAAEAIEKAIAAQKQYIANLQRIADLEKTNLETAKAKTANATEQLNRDLEVDRTGQDRIDALQKQYDLQARTNTAVEAQHRRAADINASSANFEETQRVRSGQGTPLQNQEIMGFQEERDAATMRGPAAGQSAYDAKVSAEQILYSMHGRRSASGDEMAQIHQIHERILGFMQNSVTTHQANWQAISSRLDSLEQQLNNHNTRMSVNQGF